MRNDEGMQVSVIIPTHDRCPSVLRALAALARQTMCPGTFDVVVVADGCADATAARVGAFAAPYSLTLVEQAACGPAAARNAGAERARGTVLVFMDDDIEPHPGFVAAHLAAHRDHADTVAIGYLPPALAGQHGIFREVLAEWWEGMFRVMAAPGHRFRYTDLLSGNVSLPAALFRRVGGFDTGLWCHEDYELGVRLLAAGGRFRYVAEAWGHHHERTDFARSLRRKFDEGRADVLIGRRHPGLIPDLPLARPLDGEQRRLQAAAFAAPDARGALTRLGCGMMRRAERRDRRQTWQRWCDRLLGYWYWCGVAAELTSRARLARFVAGDLAAAGGAVLATGSAALAEAA